MSAHEDLVAAVCAREKACRRGFLAQLRKVVDTDLTWFRLRPDVFTVHPGLVTVYEIEDTSRLCLRKLKLYAQLWNQLDSHDIELRLVVMDIRGGVWEPNLGVAYYHA